MRCALCGHAHRGGPCHKKVPQRTGPDRPCVCQTFILAPLRRVLGFVSVPVDDRPGAARIPEELLECGHTELQKEDIYGPTNAARQRCRRCARGTAPKEEFLAKARAIVSEERNGGDGKQG